MIVKLSTYPHEKVNITDVNFFSNKSCKYDILTIVKNNRNSAF